MQIKILIPFLLGLDIMPRAILHPRVMQVLFPLTSIYNCVSLEALVC